MIVVHLSGGMGNQMFQYATGRRLALVHDAPLALDTSGLERGIRRYALGPFAAAQRIVRPDEIARVRPPKGRRRRFAWKLRSLLAPPPLRHVRERSHRFDPSILGLPDDVYLEGYWQSEGYFADAAEAIRRDFAVAAPPAGENARLLEEIDGRCAVSLHIRRGDYASDERTGRYHGLCGIDYYRRCAAEMTERVAGAHFYVFSDEPAWAREHLDLAAMTIVDHNGPDQGHEDLRLMSSCRHHVIANSSFSWWGAWLCAHEEKIVYAPKQWFADPRPDASTVVPEGWERR